MWNWLLALDNAQTMRRRIWLWTAHQVTLMVIRGHDSSFVFMSLAKVDGTWMNGKRQLPEQREGLNVCRINLSCEASRGGISEYSTTLRLFAVYTKTAWWSLPRKTTSEGEQRSSEISNCNFVRRIFTSISVELRLKIELLRKVLRKMIETWLKARKSLERISDNLLLHNFSSMLLTFWR